VASANPLEALQHLDITNLAEDGLSVMYKGHSGSGKTHNALSWPKPLLVVQFDKNRLTLRDAIEEGEKGDIEVVFPQNWHDYAEVLIPSITNRLVEFNTIVIDTYDMMATAMWREIQGSSKRLTNTEFGVGLNRMMDTTNQLVEATRNRNDGKHYYNIIVNTHTKDVTDEGGSLLRVAPAIMGQFKDIIEDYFDYVFLCRAGTESKVQEVGGRQVSVPSKKFQCYTVPPDSYNTCKGGKLPPVISPGTHDNITQLLSASKG